MKGNKIDWSKINTDKAEKILDESETLFKSTLDVRAELEKKSTYLLGYCLLWISGLMSFVFINQSQLNFLMYPVIGYIFGLIIIAFFLARSMYPARYKFGGNFSRNLTKSQEMVDQDYTMFIIGIAQELDDQTANNISKNELKSTSLKRCLMGLICLSALCLLLILLSLFSKSLIG